MSRNISNDLKHFFHQVSNVRPIVWIGLYVALTPVFAVIYMVLPDGQFRIPDGAGTDFGSWMYYSIVTITTLGFGDYTPAYGWAQMVTAIEVMCGLILLGFFLNAVGAMKSEIDVESEIEKQRLVHEAQEKNKLLNMIPIVLHNVNMFIEHCRALASHSDKDAPSVTEIKKLIHSASKTSLCIDSLQSKVELDQWPELLENCFAFVASYQMFSSADIMLTGESDKNLKLDSKEHEDVKMFVKESIEFAQRIETELTTISAQK